MFQMGNMYLLRSPAKLRGSSAETAAPPPSRASALESPAPRLSRRGLPRRAVSAPANKRPDFFRNGPKGWKVPRKARPLSESTKEGRAHFMRIVQLRSFLTYVVLLSRDTKKETTTLGVNYRPTHTLNNRPIHTHKHKKKKFPPWTQVSPCLYRPPPPVGSHPSPSHGVRRPKRPGRSMARKPKARFCSWACSSAKSRPTPSWGVGQMLGTPANKMCFVARFFFFFIICFRVFSFFLFYYTSLAGGSGKQREPRKRGRKQQTWQTH